MLPMKNQKSIGCLAMAALRVAANAKQAGGGAQLCGRRRLDNIGPTVGLFAYKRLRARIQVRSAKS